MSKSIRLLVGLGNPDPRDARTRHNAGFWFADAVASRWDASFRSSSNFFGDVADCYVGSQRLRLLKPMTYMNRSGQSVGEAARFYKLDPGQITVIYDEIDLVPGKIRVRTGGGHGGHNGLRDIIAHLGAEFRRVRLGVGHPGSKDLVHGYVLRDFSKAERPLFDKLIDAVAAEMPLLAAGDDGAFMSRVSHLVNPPKPKPEPKADPPRDDPADAKAGDGEEEGDGV